MYDGKKTKKKSTQNTKEQKKTQCVIRSSFGRNNTFVIYERIEGYDAMPCRAVSRGRRPECGG